MKHCTECHRKYDDPSLMFCTNDGTPLTQFDSEAVTVRIPQTMSKVDMVLEIANYLRRLEAEEELIKFDPLTGLGMTIADVSEHFNAAAEKAGYEVDEKTETRAWIRRKSPEITTRWSPVDEDY